MGDVHDMHIYMYMLGVVRASLSRDEVHSMQL